MKIRIVTDSGSDITQVEAVQKGITVLPLKISFGHNEYLDGVTMSTEEFYIRLIETDEFPKTSQVPPAEYMAAFEEALKDAEHVICITVAGRLSGCFQSANIAADRFDGRVSVIDSENVAIGQRCLVDRALQLCEKDMDAKTIAAQLELEKKKVCVLALMDTMEYLKRGGRISAAAAMAGSLLSIKPVLTVEHGEVVVLGKARGSKNGNNLLNECIRQRGTPDMSKPYSLAYAGLSDILLQKYIEDNAGRFGVEKEQLPIYRIGCAIGTHVGPGAIGLAYFME